jgi:hypothetical protein
VTGNHFGGRSICQGKCQSNTLERKHSTSNVFLGKWKVVERTISVQTQCICLLIFVYERLAGGKVFVCGMCRTFSTCTDSNFFCVFCALCEGLSRIVRNVDKQLCVIPPSFFGVFIFVAVSFQRRYDRKKWSSQPLRFLGTSWRFSR